MPMEGDLVTFGQPNGNQPLNGSQPPNGADRERRYVPPFAMIGRALRIEAADLAAGKTVAISAQLFKYLLGLAISQSFFDQRWYLETYPDVEAAINEGGVGSAFEHYLTAGYYEGRSPGPCQVDQAWYERYYGDVAEALREGLIVDSAEHFHNNGYFEGRAATADQLAGIAQWRRVLNLP